MEGGSRVVEALSRLIAAGESSRNLKPNSLKFLVCLKSVKALLEDSNKKRRSSGVELEVEGAALLEKAVEEANVLMETSGSKIYRVWRSQSLTLKFEHVTLRIEDAIRKLCHSPSYDPQRARNCLLQLQRTSYFVDISDERLAEDIQRFLSEQQTIAIDELQKLASKLDIRCGLTLAKELEALEKEEQAARDSYEKKQIQSLIALFSRLGASSSESMQDETRSWGVSIPADFRCPLSLELMVDPVIVASGQTYERAYIQKWLSQGNMTCPKTRQRLSHDNLIPNYTVKALITSWCETNNITLPGIDDASSSLNESSVNHLHDDWLYPRNYPKSTLARSHSLTAAHSYPVRQSSGSLRRNSFQCSGAAEEARREEVDALVSELSSSCNERRKFGAAQLRLLAKDDMRNRIVISEAGGIGPLVDLLNEEDEQLQENAVTALLNLSINDNNKSEIAQAGAIQPLVKLLKEGTPVAKENAAATLFSLSVVEDNKTVIGAAGAIPPLVTLLENGSSRGKKDAATALFNLSISHENKARIVRAGAIQPLVELLSQPALGMVDKAVAILANLTTTAEGRVGIGEEGGITALVEILEAGTPRGKENAAAALLQLCINSSKHRALVLQEGAIPPLHALSQTGTPRGKEKALSLLRHFREQRAR